MEHKIDALLSERLVRLHTFLSRQGFYPVALSSLLCAGLYLTRVVIGRTWDFYSMLWNLFLAWIPYLGSIWAMHLHEKHPRRWWTLLIPFAIALAFFPNAPYIVTDLLHLQARSRIPLWFDTGMLATFAWTGVILGIYALKLMQDIVKTWVGTMLSWGFVLAVLVMSGMGIYLGRFLRWNSWDLLIQPKAILYDVAIRLRHPFGHLSTYGVTLMFAALMFVCYLTLTAGPKSKPRE
ncbi:MAG TPA: DUF1361 domain-containing protein [Anaerolineae bacterium]|nr:DUF1361 domain-containing protein [Anaerolineae bacterium]HQI83679.1 DUF1361 domain-containing protein [Anaerolineae bacterium]